MIYQKKAFIHIGTHKTGSTSIQNFIATNEGFLNHHNIYLPHIGRRHIEYADYQNIAWELSDNKKFNENDGTLEELEKEILRVNPDNLLLSSEAFGFQKDNADIPQKLKSYFENLGYEVYIIAFVRPIYRYMDSMYSEMAKRGIITVTFENYVKRTLRSKRYNYFEIFKEWEKYFDNVIILPFEKMQWESSLEVEFFKNLPISVDLEYVKKNVIFSQNERVDAKFLEAVRMSVRECKKLGLTSKEIGKVITKIKRLSKKHMWNKDPFCGLDNETAEYIYDFHKDNSIDFLSEIMKNKSFFIEKKEDFKFKKNVFHYKDFTDVEKDELNTIITKVRFNQKVIDKTGQKKKLCIVHVGMHKTGSSSIQHNLSTQVGKNFSYINLGEKNHSFHFGSFFAENPQRYHLNKVRRGFSKRQIEKYNTSFDEMFKHHIASHDKVDTFVISAEAIIGLSDKSLTNMSIYLSEFFENIKIVAYVRSPLSYANSLFQQRIKVGRMKEFSLDNILPQYKMIFEKFDNIFGKENVFLYSFDKKHLIGGDVVLDFLENNNLDIGGKNIRNTNTSLSLEGLSLLYIRHKHSQNFDLLKNRELIQALSKFGSTKPRLGKNILNPFLYDIQEDLKWIENRMNIKISDEENYIEHGNINNEKDLLDLAKKSIVDLKKLQELDLENFSSSKP